MFYGYCCIYNNLQTKNQKCLDPFLTLVNKENIPGLSTLSSGVARAFPGGRRAHPEGQNEEESEQSLRKNKKNWSRFEEKRGKWKSCPPGTVTLPTALTLKFPNNSSILEFIWETIVRCFALPKKPVMFLKKKGMAKNQTYLHNKTWLRLPKMNTFRWINVSRSVIILHVHVVTPISILSWSEIVHCLKLLVRRSFNYEFLCMVYSCIIYINNLLVEFC